MNKENIEAVYKLSGMQEGILFHYLLSPGTGAYVEQSNSTLEGELDLDCFRRAWAHVIEKFDVLRTTFLWENLEQPVQVVHRRAGITIEELDWSHMSEDEQESASEVFMRKDRLESFDLTKLPLQRVRLFYLGNGKQRLLWTFHHILMDGWSSDMVSNQVRGIYTKLHAGQEVKVTKSVPYRTYIKWLESRDMVAAEAFWRKRLAGFSAPTGFGVSRPVKQQRAEAYAQEKRLVPIGIVSALKNSARRNHLTLYSVVHSAYALLLSRYSGDGQVVFGTTTAGRTLDIEGINQMVGVFIHTFPVNVRVDPDMPLVQWIKRLQSEQMEATQFEYAPLQQLRGWSDVPGNLPLFESILVYENYAGGVATSKRKESSDFSNDTTTNYPLTFIIYPGVDLFFRIIYDVRRFDHAIIQRLMGHMEELLRNMAQSFDRPLASLNLVTEEERRDLLRTWNETREPYPAHEDMGHLLERAATNFIERPAITFIDDHRREVCLTYAQLRAAVSTLSGQLRHLGVGPDVLVGVYTERGMNMLIALLAIFDAGAGYLPLDPTFPDERVAFMIEDAGVTLVLTEAGRIERVPRTRAQVLGLNEKGSIDGVPSAHRETGPRFAAPDGVCYMIYTSGSTGKPKGVLITHRNLVAYMASLTRLFGIGEQDTWFGLATFTFDISVMELFMPGVVGAHLIYTSKHLVVDDTTLIRLIHEKRTTWMQATPATWRMLISAGWQGHDQLNIVSGGEALPYELSHQMQQRCKILWNNYGPTETTIYTNARPIRQRTPEKEIGGIEPIGPNLGNTEIYILDPHMNLLPLLVPGEIFLGGLLLARCYQGQPALTAEKFVPDPFSSRPGSRLYRSGDLGRFLPDHTIESFGRVDHQIKLRGFRIELGEVDACLSLHPDIDVAACALREVHAGDRALVAFVVFRQGASLEPEEMRAFLARSLPDYMIPSHFSVMEKMPMSARGKADREALPQFGEGRLQTGKTHVPPRNESERLLVQIWQEILGLENIGVENNFFDLGGHSLRLVQMRGKIVRAFARDISMVDLFEHTTIRSLADFLTPEQEVVQDEIQAVTPAPAQPATAATPLEADGVAMAVIGMSGRFPGAANVDQFWENIRDGVTSIRFFSNEEMKEVGVPETLLENPNFIKAYGSLDEVDGFDATFFNITPREAEITDPQHRIFLEGAWHALENAGYNPFTYAGRIGVFGGAGINSYALRNLSSNSEAIQGLSSQQLVVANDRSFVTTKVSYKLDLKGPSIVVQTACSTSLVAVIQACESLLAGRCEMALAGGVSVIANQKAGYFYEEGGIGSADGHCRPFEARASGTVFGSGMGVVVLKRLADARADGDRILAVIKGYAINNDGSRKAGYSAPAVEGQVRVIRDAQKMGGIDPASITYMEAHGTGTPLGDPIEVAALSKTFSERTDKKAYCALGSVKANVGHLDIAAGIAGFIKVVKALQNGQIPPSPDFEQANPALDLADSPFFVNTRVQDWPRSEDQSVRRAAVSSFGIGGTNAHLILEEAPAPEREAVTEPSHYLLPLSSRNRHAFEQMAANLAEALGQRPDVNLQDVAFTLQAGREAFAQRGFLVVDSVAQAHAQLTGTVLPSTHQSKRDGGVVFMFTGQGSQRPAMAATLYREQPVFRGAFDHCAQLLAEYLDVDLRELIYGAGDDEAEAAARLEQTAYTQPALFAVEYALARLWLSWGVKPKAMIGHSIGEYVAACLSGVFSLEDALVAVAARGRTMQAQPEGAMLAVPLAEDQLRPRLSEALALAAVNGSQRCTVAGPEEAIAAFQQQLSDEGIASTRLHTSHAFHSPMMDGAVAPLAEILGKIKLSKPGIPFISNVSGTWISEAEATDPAYWSRHMRQTVRFADGLDMLLQDPGCILLEIGPGGSLAALAKRHERRNAEHAICASLPSRRDQEEWPFLLYNLGLLWQAGARVDWEAFNRHLRPHRLDLPVYPFQRQRYWIDPRKSDKSKRRGRQNREDWFYLPSWKPALTPQPAEDLKTECWLLFTDGGSLATALRQKLAATGHTLVEVLPGASFEKRDPGTYVLRPGHEADYETLLASLVEGGRTPHKVIHLWSLGPPDDRAGDSLEVALDRAFYSLLFLARAIGGQLTDRALGLTVVTNHSCKVEHRDVVRPERALIMGPVKVIPRELPQLRCLGLDLELPPAESAEEAWLAERVLLECSQARFGLDTPSVAYRGRRRFVPSYDRVPVRKPATPQTALKPNGVYLITGGLGGIGLALADYLVDSVKARIVFTSRSEFPAPGEWQSWLDSHAPEDPGCVRIRKLQDLEARGGTVWVARADSVDGPAMEAVAAGIRARFGKLDGVIHAAGIAGGGMIQLKTRQAASRVLTPKVQGTLVLARVVADLQPDFIMLCSSVSAVAGEFGQVDYCAANAYLDAFAERGLNGTSVVSVNWCAWREVGMAVNTQLPEHLRKAREESLGKALSPSEGAQAFHALLATAESRMVVSTLDLETVIEQTAAHNADLIMAVGEEKVAEPRQTAYPRPQLASVFVAPRNPTEQAIADIWKKQIGIDRVGIADNFFELGGDSLMGLQVVALINREFASNISAASLYEAPTVGAVAQLVSPEKAVIEPSFKREHHRGSARKDKIRRKQKKVM